MIINKIYRVVVAAVIATAASSMYAFPPLPDKSLHKTINISRAREICDSIPLHQLEGIWIYPEDNVTVLILREPSSSSSAFQSYSITVVDSSDARLSNGDRIGSLIASTEPRKFTLSLFTRKKGNVFASPQKCLATLSADEEALTLSEQKKGMKLRFSLNPNTLLPRTWRILRFNFSSPTSSSGQEAPAGMIKIYPSYDGNGSSRRSPRYL